MTTNYRNIIQVFNQAHQNGLKYPKMHASPAISLRRAGSQSRYPGSLSILHQGEYIGRIYTNGVLALNPSQGHLQEEVTTVLNTFNGDFATAAREYGYQTGTCGFCGLELTHENSIEFGYGPICAAKYGLPHTYEKPKGNEVESVDLDAIMKDIKL